MLLGAALFLSTWIVATVALYRLRWFRRRDHLSERLYPYVGGGDPTRETEEWLRYRSGS